MFNNFILQLQEALKNPLPGEEAQYLMAPAERRPVKEYLEKNPHPKQSGVLLLLYPSGNEINTVLILRSKYDGVHSGQVSLPGGKQEEGDDDLYHTALREAKEEIGIDIDKVKYLGALSELYIPVSNFLVKPYLGYMLTKPVFIVDTKEVERIIETSAELWKYPFEKSEKEIMFSDGRKIKAPCFYIGGLTVWGATAMILSEFAVILKQLNPSR